MEHLWHLSVNLGRSIKAANGWLVQICPICEIELRLMDSRIRSQLDAELFSLFDDHRCRAPANEETFQRAERASVRAGECALLLAALGDPLAARAEAESLRIARWVDEHREAA